MRLSNKIKTVFKILVLELGILTVVGLVFLVQFHQAKEDFIRRTGDIAGVIAEQAENFFSTNREGKISDFFLFLEERLGRKKLFNTFEVPAKFFTLVLRRNVGSESVSSTLRDEFNSKEGFLLEDKGWITSISVPFFVKGETEPFGVVKIEADEKALMKKVLESNAIMYLTLFLLFNNQIFVIYALLRRRKEVIFEKGYLREHSIGALKIMYKVLGDVIADHEGGEEEEKPSVEEKNKKTRDNKVIRFSELLEKKKK